MIENRFCKWKYDEQDDMWETECKNALCFIEGGIKDNRYGFCPYCGNEIREMNDEETEQSPKD